MSNNKKLLKSSEGYTKQPSIHLGWGLDPSSRGEDLVRVEESFDAVLQFPVFR